MMIIRRRYVHVQTFNNDVSDLFGVFDGMSETCMDTDLVVNIDVQLLWSGAEDLECVRRQR